MTPEQREALIREAWKRHKPWMGDLTISFNVEPPTPEELAHLRRLRKEARRREVRQRLFLVIALAGPVILAAASLLGGCAHIRPARSCTVLECYPDRLALVYCSGDERPEIVEVGGCQVGHPPERRLSE